MAKKRKARKKPEQQKEEPRRTFSAQEKVEAVLSLWMGRRKPVEVQREMGIHYTLLSNWQNVAMEAMLTVFEPRVRQEEDRPPALSPKLEKLLKRKLRQREAKGTRIQQRLMSAASPKEKAGKRK